MKLTVAEAKELLNAARGKTKYSSWIDHCICVGDTASKIGKALNKKGYKIDIEKVKVLGYMHDIGKIMGDFEKHDINGYIYLKDKGYDLEYCNICSTHSYLNNDVLCTAGGVPENIPFRNDFVKTHVYTIEEKIINLCDLMCPQSKKVYTLDKRLIDIIIRRGVHSNTQYHVKEAYKLKEYFDNLLGYNLYNLFPEIKENL